MFRISIQDFPIGVTAHVFLTLICQIESRMYGGDRETPPERSVNGGPDDAGIRFDRGYPSCDPWISM